jgi:hypothetical protein
LPEDGDARKTHADRCIFGIPSDERSIRMAREPQVQLDESLAKTIEYFEAMLVEDGAPHSASPDRAVNSRAISPSAAL